MHRPFLRATAFLDDWLTHQVAKAGTIGLAVAVHHKDQVMFNATYGWADVAKQQKLTTDHLFNIGSLSKMVTASAIMLLVQQQTLSLDDRAVQYLPWLAKHHDGRMIGITIGQLLAHRSGLARDGALADYWQHERPLPDATALQKILLDTDITLDGYAKFKYSNLGYALLGQIIEAVSNLPYDEFVTKHILSPLGLQDAIISGAKHIETPVATGYAARVQGKRITLPGFVTTNAFTSTVGWHANAQSLCAFLAWHFGTTSTIINSTVKEQMHRESQAHWVPEKKRGTAYGNGFMTQTLDGRQLIGHGGSFFCHRSYAFYDPKQNIGVVILTNTRDAPLLSLARGIFNTIDFFLEYANEPLLPQLEEFNVSIANLWTVARIVATNKKIVTCNLDDTLPFLQAEKLAQTGPHTLQIVQAPDTSSEGELVHFSYKNNELQLVNYAGQILRPAKLYAEWAKTHFSHLT